MAISLKPTASWNGISSGIISCQYVNSHGRMPGQATLIVEEFYASTISNTGDLVFSDGFNTVTVPDCRLLEGKVINAKRYVSFVVLDRRWRWALKTIKGWYNQRDNLDQIKPETLMQIPDLINLLMNALGETQWNSDDIPEVLDVNLPAINWDVANAGDELEKLLQPFGFRVCYQVNGNIAVLVHIGDGMDLPEGGVVQNSSSAALPVVPEKFTLQGRPVWYTAAILLEAVGAEPNGEIKLINDLSFKPKNGWTHAYPPFGSGNDDGLTIPTATVVPVNPLGLPNFPGVKIGALTPQQYRDLANSCVYKWYRITTNGPNGKPIQIPGYTDKKITDPNTGKMVTPKITSIEQILLGDGIHTNYNSNSKVTQDFVDNALVYGSFYRGEPFITQLNPADHRIDVDFEIDPDLKLIKFAKAVYRCNPVQKLASGAIGGAIGIAGLEGAQKGTGTDIYPGFAPMVPFGQVLPGWLVLIVSVNIRDEAQYGFRLNRFTQSVPGFSGGDGEYELFRDDIGFAYYRLYDPNSWVVFTPPNEAQVIKTTQNQANSLLNSLKNANQEVDTSEKHYDTYRTDIDVDGKIQQVTYSAGGTTTLTTASTNTEHFPYLPRFDLRQITGRLVFQNLRGEI
jgi:hypothetical protein